MDKSDIFQRIDVIEWNSYKTAYGDASKIPCYLKNLFNEETEMVMEATHNLWCSLCHQHAYISSAALPAYEFLIIKLDESDESIKVEILDILYGFVVCINNLSFDPMDEFSLEWGNSIWGKMKKDISKLEKLAESSNEDISYFSESICEKLKLPGHIS